MGTRAVIFIDGVFFVATHWDGDPRNLGANLLNSDLSPEAVRNVAEHHVIDCEDISVYNDYAEYQYNICIPNVFYRKVSGQWKERKFSRWYRVNKKLKKE